MFAMKIPPETDKILSEMEILYPNLAKKIRLMWSDEQPCQEFFEELLSYRADFDRDGFTLEAYRKLEQIKEAYDKCLFEYKTWHLSPEEKAKRAQPDPWGSVYSPFILPKRRKKPWEDE